jgi:hypothetical protein
MYAALWKLIPGPLWVRILVAVVVVGAVIAALMMFAFPWVESLMTPPDVTVN